MIFEKKKKKLKSSCRLGKEKRQVGIQKNLFNKFIIISLLFSTCTGAVFSGTAFFSVNVYALPPTLLKVKTIGELIITLAAAGGTGLSGPVAVPQITSAYNYTIEDLVTQDILNLQDSPDATDQEVLDALTFNRLYELDATEFRSLMAEDWQLMVDSGMDAALRFNDLWNTQSQTPAIDNLGAILVDICEVGYASGEMTIRNIANPVEAVTVRLEDLGTALKSYWHGTMLSGVKLKPPSNYIDAYNASLNKYGAQIGNYWENSKQVNDSMFFDPLHAFLVGINGNNTTFRLYNISQNPFEVSNMSSRYTDRQYTDSWITYSWPGGKPDNPNSSAVKFGQNLVTWFDSWSEADTYVNSIKVGDINYNPVLPYTPNIINQDEGFLNTYNEDDAESPLGENDRMDLLDADDYNNMLQDLEEEDPENVAPIYDNFIQPYINQEYVEPEEPLPTYAPVRPVEPEQPTLPEKEEITSEDQEKTLTYATAGLEEIFPFCIPFDIWKMLRTLISEREAPVFEFPLVIESQGINETVTVDMSVFDPVATICRILELILFVVGLGVATRRLIGA